MSQHDLDLADAAGAAFRADANNALQALGTLQSGSSAPSTTYARMLWADTTDNLLKQRNAANSAWIVRGSLDESFVLSRSSNTILGVADRGKTLIATAGFTQTLTAAATLGDGWFIDLIVDSGATLVIDPNSTETVDGATTKSIVGPAQGRLVCNGTLFRTIGFSSVVDASDSAKGIIEIATQAEIEAGSSNVLAVTPGRLFGAVGFTDYFQSADQSISLGGGLTIAHGLGRTPILTLAYLKCTTAEGGFSVGQLTPWTSHDGDGSAGTTFPAVVCDSTNINVKFGGLNPRVTRLDTGASFSITLASWRAVFRVWG